MEQRAAAGRDTVAAAADVVRAQLPTDWPIELCVEPGSGAQTLEELSDVAALIIVERRSISAIQRWHTGSTTSRVAARARCPVLVTHENQDAGPLGAAVVVGVDDRGHAGIAVDVAFDEAELRRTDLVAVHAWHPAERASGFIPRDVDDLTEARRCAQLDLAEALAGHCARHPDVPVRRRVVGGPVIQALTKASDGAGLLVLGRHGEQRVGTIALGSIARHCLSEVDCPVMITPVDRAERVPPRWIGTQVPVSPGY
jgi:nucleotide-binding universal stress UspA family protein